MNFKLLQLVILLYYLRFTVYIYKNGIFIIITDQKPKMYPTKSMNDYMSEMNRLFPRSTENGKRTF